LFIGPTFPENLCKSIQKFLRKVANRQTDRQANNDKNISSLEQIKTQNIIPTHKPPVIRAFNSEPMTFSFTSNFNPDQRTTLPWHSLKFNILQWRHQRNKWSVHITYVTYLTESNQNFLKNESLIATLLSQTWPFKSVTDNEKQKHSAIFFHFPTAWAPTHWLWRQRSPYCFSSKHTKIYTVHTQYSTQTTTMWANAQLDATTQNPLKFAEVPKITKRSQLLVGRSSPYCENMWGRHCCL